jgi:hypothetical protein
MGITGPRPDRTEPRSPRVRVALALETAMSVRITWGVCPTCGSRAAVLWAAVAVRDGEPVSERPVELVCLGRFDHALSEQLAALQE